MDNYKIIIVIEHEFVFHVEFDFAGTFSDETLAVYARLLCDGVRAMLHPVSRVHYALLWRISGHLSAYSDLRVFHRPGDFTSADPLPLTGARNVAPMNQWTVLKTARDRILGDGIYHYFEAAVSQRDLSETGAGRYMNIALESPLLAVSLPYFNAMAANFPALQNIRASHLGEVESLPDVSPDFVARRGVYQAKRQRHALRLPYVVNLMRSRILQHCRAARTAANRYADVMEQFTHRWGDNDSPDGLLAILHNSAQAASIWYDLAARLSLNIPDPNPLFTFEDMNNSEWDAHPNLGAPDNNPRWQTAAERFTVVDRSFPIVLSCIQSLYACQRRAEAILAEIDEVTAHNTTEVLNFDNFKNRWFCQDLNEHFGSGVVNSDDNPASRLWVGSEGRWSCVLVETVCQQQQAAYHAWREAGGDNRAQAIYQRFEEISHIIMQTKNALHLLAAFLIAHSDPASGDQLNRDRDGHPIPRLESFPSIPARPVDYWLIGHSCDWIETRSFNRDPNLTLSFPCLPPQIAARIPYRRPLGRPFLIDNSVVVSNRIQAVALAALLILQGHSDQAQIYFSQRYNQWAVGPSDPGDPIPRAPVP